MYEKDFAVWSSKKQEINRRQVPRSFFFYEREIWWCSLGVNIGVEYDGKNENFERPVLIFHKFYGEMAWVFPMTSKEKSDPHNIRIEHDNRVSWICLSQIRTISTKRLIRKMGNVSERAFEQITEKFSSIKQIGPRISARSSEAEATCTGIITHFVRFVKDLIHRPATSTA